jgi:hypothetical protein
MVDEIDTVTAIEEPEIVMVVADEDEERFDGYDVLRDEASVQRQLWLTAALEELRVRFHKAGFELPEQLRISLGWPKGGSGTEKIGQYFAPKVSGDEHHEIFISPKLDDPVRLIGVTAHELAHAVAGAEAGHKAPFKRVAVAVGLNGPMRATEESEEFAKWVRDEVLPIIGEYPAAAITIPERAKQTTRMVKCECPQCGCLARMTREWIEKTGGPICGLDMTRMVVGGVTVTDEANVYTPLHPSEEDANVYTLPVPEAA